MPNFVIQERRPYFTQRFSLFAVCCLALSVNFGVALVSISKLLVVIAVLGKIFSLMFERRFRIDRDNYWTFIMIGLAIVWINLSWYWSVAAPSDRWQSLVRHERIWVLPAVFYLLDTKQKALKALLFLVVGQLFVVTSSWLLWLGVPIPWAITSHPAQYGVLFTSTLEQPVMSTVMLSLIWFLRYEIPQKWRSLIVGLSAVLTIANVFLVMTGRTGYLVMLFAIFIAIFWLLPRKWRLAAFLVPILMVALLAVGSTRFQEKILEIERDVVVYQSGAKINNNSQGQRLDYWIASIKATADKPLLGFGVGGWRTAYFKHGGTDKFNFTTNPHQQYLLWSVEAGLIGLMLLFAVFVSIYKDADLLETHTRQALRATLGITFLMGWMNCPLFGAGMSEFLLLVMGALLATKLGTRNQG